MGSATVFGGSIPAELSLPGSISCIEASVEQMIVRSERLVRVRVRARVRGTVRVRVGVKVRVRVRVRVRVGVEVRVGVRVGAKG